MGKFLGKEGLKSRFCRQFCKRSDHHLRASSGFQAFFAEILAGRILQRSRGTSLQRRYLSAFYAIFCAKLSKLNRHSRNGLAYALQIPVEYLEALSRGVAIPTSTSLKFCPHCWVPGTPPESIWMEVRAKHCFLCGCQLQQRCRQCQEPITSLKHRFCPYCGTAYKLELKSESNAG